METPEMSERTARLRMLLALEIARIQRDLVAREAFLMVMWSRHRTREPFLDTTFSRWRSLSMTDLACLAPATIQAVHGYFDELESFRLYVRYTDDMPMMLAEAYATRLRRLSRLGDAALVSLGGVPKPMHDLPDLPLPEPPPAPTMSDE